MKSTKRALMLNAARDVADVVSSALEELQVEVMAVQDLLSSGSPPAVTDAIQKADLIVADVTEPRPNMFYELGYAHALRKPTLILLSTEASGTIPFDVAGYQVLTYDPQNLFVLRRHVQRFVEHQILRLAY